MLFDMSALSTRIRIADVCQSRTAHNLYILNDCLPSVQCMWYCCVLNFGVHRTHRTASGSLAALHNNFSAADWGDAAFKFRHLLGKPFLVTAMQHSHTTAVTNRTH